MTNGPKWIKRRNWWMILTCGLIVGLVFLKVYARNRLLWVREYPNGIDIAAVAGECWLLDQRNGTIQTCAKDSTDRTIATVSPGARFLSAGNSGALILEGDTGARFIGSLSAVTLLDAAGTEKGRYGAVGSIARAEIAEDGSIVIRYTEGLLQVIDRDGRLVLSEVVGKGLTGSRIMAKDLIVVCEPELGQITLRHLNGIRCWSRRIDGSELPGAWSIDLQTNVIFATGRSLMKLNFRGIVMWRDQLPKTGDTVTRASASTSNSDNIRSIQTDVTGRIFCRTQGGSLLMYHSDGRPGWTREIGMAASAITVTPRGNLLIACEEFTPRLSGTATNTAVSSAANITNFATSARNSRVICLSPEGRLLWEQKLPNKMRWFRPKSIRECQAIIQYILGYHAPGNLSAPIVTADGTVYVSGSIGVTSRLYAIEADEPMIP